MRIYGGSLLFWRRPDGPAIQIEVHILQELEDHLEIAIVGRQIFVILWGEGSHLGQIIPRTVREIVMLDMVAQIDVRDVPPSEVVVSLLPRDELVVLGDDVDGGRVGSDRAQPREDHVGQRPGTPQVQDDSVQREDGQVIEEFIAGETGLVHEERTSGVEKADYYVEDVFIPFETSGQLGLPLQGQVGIPIKFSQKVVVV